MPIHNDFNVRGKPQSQQVRVVSLGFFELGFYFTLESVSITGLTLELFDSHHVQNCINQVGFICGCKSHSHGRKLFENIVQGVFIIFIKVFEAVTFLNEFLVADGLRHLEVLLLGETRQPFNWQISIELVRICLENGLL
mmetsp:Transcript_18671/g.17786  ORF Transcript_18671/g.17786 Transcript_18671/m.17786 type:complete len:139 (+) Transcript_18671:190-606(+)